MEENEVTTVGTTDVDYKALYEETNTKLEDKTNKVWELEWLIQKHKEKKPAKADTPNTWFWEEQVIKLLADTEFYKSNPEMSEYKEQIDKFTSNGNISNEQAKLLVLQWDPTIANRQNAQNANITDWASWGGTISYSQEDLYNLWQKDPALKRRAMEEISSGKAIETA